MNLGTIPLLGTLNSIQNNGIIQTQNTSALPFTSGKTWAGSGILNMNATSTAQTLVAGTYNNLTLSSTAGTTAVANVTVNGKLDLPAANASSTKGSLDMDSFTLTMGPDGVNTGVGDVTGIINRDSFTTNKLYTFGHPNSSITFPPAGTLPTSMSAKLTIGAAPSWKAGTILRQFDIIHTGAVDTKAIIRQHYLDSELNGNVESKLAFWAHTISALNTFDQGRSNNNTTENWVEISNANVGLYFKNTFDQVYISLDETSGSDLVWNGSTSTSWITAANWTPEGVPSASSKVFIPNVSTTSNRSPIIDATSSVKTITIDAGAVVNTPANSVLSVFDGAGAWQNNGTFNPGNGTVLFNNLDATISGTTAFNNLTIATGAGLRALEGNYMSIAGTLTNNGTMFTTLIPNTIEFKGTNQVIPAVGGEAFGGYHNLIVSGTGASTLAAAISTMNVRGNLILNQAVPFTGKTINLAGVSDQTIGGTAGINFNNLIVNKETGAVILAKDIAVGGTLTLTKGNVVIGANNLTLSANPVVGIFNTNTMIVADGTGVVRRPFAGIGSYFFPIGELAGAPSFAPITVNVTAGTFSSAFVGVNVSNLKHPNNNSSQNYLRKYWNVTQTGITGAVATITGKYDALDVLGAETEIAAAQLNGAFNVASNPWIKFGSLSNNTLVATNAILTSGQTSAFTGLKAGVFGLEVYGYGDFCINSQVYINAVLTGGDAPFTYNWSNGLSNTAEVLIPTSPEGTTNYTLTVIDANGFSATDTNIPVEIFPASVGGTIANATQQICASSLPEDLQLSGSVGKVLHWQKSTDINFTPNTESDPNNVTNISNFTTTLGGAQIGPLSETTYFRAVLQSGDCEESLSSVATITIKSTTWNGNAWSNGLPDSSTTAIFASNYTATASIEACTILVTNGAAVIIPATFDVTLNGALTVESGSFKLESNTNLIQLTDVQNSGNIIVERESSKLFRLDYTMWGSPVTGGQTLLNFSPLTNTSRFYTYKSSSDVFQVIDPNSNGFISGQGYLIRMPNNHTIFGPEVSPTSWTGIFEGKPTNGPVGIVLDAGGSGFNMLSNPYASMISADAFLNNNSAEIDGTLYFWRRRNNIPAENEGTSAYYATYTIAGGTGVASTSVNTSGTFVSEVPNGFIQVGQGFIAKKISGGTGSALFTNSMRTLSNNANQFFKSAIAEERSRIWLNVSNTAGEFGQTLVAYMPQAENGLDRTDGKYLGDGSTALTSWLEDAEYIIQGRAPFAISDVVALNFKTATAGAYTIAIDRVDGLFSGNQDIFLRDNFTGTNHDLKNSAYTFATEAGSFNARFDIVYFNPLSTKNPIFDSNSVILYKKENNVVINSGRTILENVEVYDVSGRLLAVAKKINSNEVSINVGETNQVLIVNITSSEGIKITKKTIN